MSQVLVSSEKVYKVLGFTDSVTDCGCCGRTELKGTYVMEHIESGEINYFGCVCAAKHQGYTKKEFTTEAKAKLKEVIKQAKNEVMNCEERINKDNAVTEFYKVERTWEEIQHQLKTVFNPLSEKVEAKRKEIAAKYHLKVNQTY